MLVSRYCHIYPAIDKNYLLNIMQYKPKYFFLKKQKNKKTKKKK